MAVLLCINDNSFKVVIVVYKLCLIIKYKVQLACSRMYIMLEVSLCLLKEKKYIYNWYFPLREFQYVVVLRGKSSIFHLWLVF